MSEPQNGPTYTPIDCDRYSEFEVAILKRREAHLRWRDDTIVHDQTVLPLDLQTKDHEEFLIVRLPDATQAAIRLDCILLLETT